MKMCRVVEVFSCLQTRHTWCPLSPKGQQDRDQLLQDHQEDGHEEAEDQHVEPPDPEP